MAINRIINNNHFLNKKFLDMKKQTITNRTENKNLVPFNTVGSFLTAGLLLFGAASCDSGERQTETEDNTLATEETYDNGLGYEGTQDNEPVTNTDTEDFDRWDANTDRQWDQDEFNTRMNDSGEFNEWDTDRDGSLNENEFNEGSRYLQDNQANTRDNTEITGTNTNSNLGAFDDWDQNGDDVITEEEFNNARFNSMDTNRDGSLSTDEYNNENNQMNQGSETNTDTTGTGGGY
jgi:hypothetical protein